MYPNPIEKGACSLHPNPNQFLTVLFSFIPGAGHMYLGLMKRGASFMLGFALTIAGASLFGMFGLLQAAFGILIPVVWFIAFFDFWRYPRMNAEEKAAVEDDFLVPRGMKLPDGAVMRKVRIAVGILLILAGGHQIYRIFWWDIIRNFERYPVLHYLASNLPTMLGGLAIIVVGLLLIFWKSRQLKKEAGRDEE